MKDVPLSIHIIYHFNYNVTFLITPHAIHYRLELHMLPHFTNDWILP